MTQATWACGQARCSARSSGTTWQVSPIAESRSRHRLRGGVAIGDQIVDLESLAATGLCSGSVAESLRMAASAPLNAYLARGASAWSAVRSALFNLLRRDAKHQSRLRACLLPQSEAE